MDTVELVRAMPNSMQQKTQPIILAMEFLHPKSNRHYLTIITIFMKYKKFIILLKKHSAIIFHSMLLLIVNRPFSK